MTVLPVPRPAKEQQPPRSRSQESVHASRRIAACGRSLDTPSHVECSFDTPVHVRRILSARVNPILQVVRMGKRDVPGGFYIVDILSEICPSSFVEPSESLILEKLAVCQFPYIFILASLRSIIFLQRGVDDGEEADDY